MDKPISVGDLVMVVRGHECAVRIKGGIPWRVQALTPQFGGGWHCSVCGQWDLAPEETVGAVAPWNKVRGNGMPLGWLKRIPPLSELEGEKRDEDLREPA